MADKVTISFAFDDKVTPRLDVIASRIKEIDKALQKARNFKVNTRSVSTSLDRVNGRLGRVLKNLDDIKAKKLFIDTRGTNIKLANTDKKLQSIKSILGSALGTVKINTGTAQRSLNTMLTKVETIQNALGKTQLNPSKVAAPKAPKDGRATGRDAFAKLRGAFSRTRDPILQVNKALVQFRKEFRAAAKITKGFPGLRTAIKDFQKFEDAIKKIQKANFKNASASFKAFANSLKNASRPLREITELLKRAQKSAKDFQKALGVSLNTLRLLRDILQRTQKGLRDLKKGTKQTTLLGKAFRGLGKRIPLVNKFFGGPALPTFVGRIRAARFALVDLTNVLKKVGLGQFFEVIKKGIADAANFELLTAQISTLIQGLGPGGAGTVITGGLGARFDFTDSERGLEGALTALNRLVRDKAVEAGQDIEKTFKAAYDSISSGVPIDDLAKFIDQASKLAVGGVTDISKATKLLLSVFQTTGRDIENLEEQTDSLFTLVRLGRTTVDELSGSLGRVLPIAQAAGVSVDEVGGAIAALSAGGLTTAEAVTALRQVLNKIINPSVASTKLARQLGIELNTAAIQSKGLKGVLEEIALATSSNTDVIGNLFPRVRALVGVLSLLRGEGTQTLDDFFDPFADKAGATETAFERLSNTFTITVNKLRSAFTSLRAELFEGLLPVLTNTAERVKNIFVGIFDPLRDSADFASRAFQQIDALVARGPLSPAGGITPEQGEAARGAIIAARSKQVANIFSQFLSQLAKIADQFIEIIGDTISIALEIGLATLGDPNSRLGRDISKLFGTVLGSLKTIGGQLIDQLRIVLEDTVDDLVGAFFPLGLRSIDRNREVPTKALLAAQNVNTSPNIPDDRFEVVFERIANDVVRQIETGKINAFDPIVNAFVETLQKAGGGQGNTRIEQLRDIPNFNKVLRQTVTPGASIDDPNFVVDFRAIDQLRASFFEVFIPELQGFSEEAAGDIARLRKEREEETEARLRELDARREALSGRTIETDFGGIETVKLEDILGIGFGPAGLFREFVEEFDLSPELQNLLRSIFAGTEEAVLDAQKDPGLNIAAREGLKKIADLALENIAEQQASLSLGAPGAGQDSVDQLLGLTQQSISNRSDQVRFGTGGIQEIEEVRTLANLVKSLPAILQSLSDLPEIGGDELREKFEENISVLLEELPKIAAGGQIGENFKTTLATFRSLISEATQLKTISEEELELRILSANNASVSLEFKKLELQQAKELRDLEAKGIKRNNVLFFVVQGIQQLEQERFIIKKKQALEERKLTAQNSKLSLEAIQFEIAAAEQLEDVANSKNERVKALLPLLKEVIDLERERIEINRERDLENRRLEAAGATFRLEQFEFERKALEELEDVRNSQDESIRALLPLLEKVVGLELTRLKINQDLARIQAQQALSQANNATAILQRRAQGRGTRDLQQEGLRGQIGGLQGQRAIAEQQLQTLIEEDASAAAIIAKRAEIAEFNQEILQLQQNINALDDFNLEAFKVGLSEFIDSLPTRTEIALQAVQDFATRTADFFADTIGKGLKTLLTDGIDGLKEGVKELDTIFAQFFGQLLIDIGTAIIRSILLRTILAALPPGIGSFLGGGFNKGGLVPGFNDGGTVGGPPNVNRDVVPAMLTPGEFVVRREAVNAVGADFLMGLNMMGRPSSRIGMSKPRLGSVAAFNAGGSVNGLQSGGGSASPTYVVANEENLQSLLSGGKNEMLNFLRDNRNNF